MKIEDLKKYTPFIVVGGIAGIFALVTKNKSGGSVTTSPIPSPLNGVNGSVEATQSSQNSLSDLATQTQAGFQTLTDKFNTDSATQASNSDIALSSQKSYFENLLSGLSDKLSLSNLSVINLTSQVNENTIATNKLENNSSNPTTIIEHNGLTNPTVSQTLTPQQTYNVDQESQWKESQAYKNLSADMVKASISGDVNAFNVINNKATVERAQMFGV